MTELLLLSLARLAGQLLLVPLRHPATSAVVLLLGVVMARAGVVGALAALVGLALALVSWRHWHRRSYRRLVLSRYRSAVVYKRRWQAAMVTCGLATTVGGREYLPTIRRVGAAEHVDRVLVELLSGQSPEDWEAATTRLAHTFNALTCRVSVDRPGRVWLEFGHGDLLADPIPALAPIETPDLDSLVLGRRQDGEPWTVRLLGTHHLVAGATGSGKGSVLWSLVRALAPAVKDGSVQLWAIDPKGGMELTPGAGLFTRFAYHDTTSMVELLEEAVTVMRQRAELLRCAGLRTHTPTCDTPLVVVLVDEMSALTAYCGDRDLKKRAESALQLLLAQGRAPGVVVVAAVQDPGKDVVGFRDLFPSRIALRLLEDVQVDMVLGRSARHRGAECDRIPTELPGVGYVVLDGIREPVRVRSAYVGDDDLAAMVREYGPGRVIEKEPEVVERRLSLVDQTSREPANRVGA